MNRHHRMRAAVLAVLLVAVAMATWPDKDERVPVTAVAGAADSQADDLPPDVFVARAYYDKVADISRLAGFDVFEFNNKEERYVLVGLDAAGFRRLEAMGFRVTVDPSQTLELTRPHAALPGQVSGIPGFPCYRTVEETYSTAQGLVDAHPGLAAWVDAGDSWERTAGLGGYDLRVLRLTNSAVAGPKPKILITASIHAREYTPSELVTRFAEHLVNGYGANADATWILDHHEIHLLLQANPDGRKQAEGGLAWRKNTNQDYCSAASNSRGADLNRNFGFQWGCCGGSSGDPCSFNYRGPVPASEPETQAVQDYLVAEFPDQREAALSSPAPPDATGVYIDIHSFGQLVLWPWGFTSQTAPNSTPLQTLGRKLAYFNGYEPEQSIGLYPTDGTTDDFAYGELGLASYTFELGTNFFESCSAFENVVLPNNLPALLYAAKVARTPYLTPAGPDALAVTTSPAVVTIGEVAVISAILDDTRYSQVNGVEPAQAIVAAAAYAGVPPWDTGGNPIPVPLAAVDGSFDSPTEGVMAEIDTAGLGVGRHLIFVRGQDANGNWGPVTATFLDVQMPPAPDFTLSVTPRAQAVCAPASAAFSVTVGSLLNFDEPVGLSSAGNPAGSSAAFADNPITPPANTQLTVSNTNAADGGSYRIEVIGTAPVASLTHTATVALELFADVPGSPVLVNPANGAIDVAPAPLLSWEALSQATGYEVEIATDPGFDDIVDATSALEGVSYVPVVPLDTATVYHWRVRAGNLCGPGANSAVFKFTTEPAPGECAPGSRSEILLEDGFESGAAGWSHDGSGDTWALWSANVHGGSTAWHAEDVAAVSDQRLTSPALALPSGRRAMFLSFWNYQDMEQRTGGCYDGGILEISIDGGGSWQQIEAGLLTDPYDGPIAFGNPLASQPGWCGQPQDWLRSVVTLDAYAGKTAQFRFRLGTDASVGAGGWTIDDVTVRSCQDLHFEYLPMVLRGG